MKRLLVIRFSALGDVAMILPVLKRVLTAYPETEITFVTRSQFAPLFENIERLKVTGIDLHKEHKGITGLYRLSKRLRTEVRPDVLLDLHGVLRTYLLSFFARLTGLQCFAIQKDRKSKKKMIRTKELKSLPHTTERYLDVFRKAGFILPTGTLALPSVCFTEKDRQAAAKFITPSSLPCIAFAPFAKHETKTLPLQTSERLIKQLQESYTIYLLGGKEEEGQFNEWEKKFNNVRSTCKLSLVQQVALISEMKAVISMDSGNMHLAAIQGIPVISIWGATHPCFGFSGIQTDSSTWISSEKNISCRPCSVFGNKPCTNKDEPLVCLKSISVESIVAALEKAIK